MALGLFMLLFGRGQLFRIVAAPLGALIGSLWVPAVAAHFGSTMPASQVGLGASIGLAFLGALFPPGVIFFAFGMPIGLIAAQLVGPTDWLLAFLPGFIIGGAIGVVLHPVVSALISSVAGAWVLTLGLLAVLAPLLASVGSVAKNPVIVFSMAGCFAMAGAIYQLLVRGSADSVSRQKRERLLQRAKQKEDRALEKRWASYSKKKRS